LQIPSLWLKDKLTPQQAQLLANTRATIDLQHHFSLPLINAYYPFSLNSLKKLKNRHQFSVQLNNTSPNSLLANANLQLGAVKLVASGSMAWKDQQLSLSLNPDSEVKLQKLKSQLTSTNQLALKLTSKLQAQWPFNKDIKWQELVISPAKISVSALPWQTQLASISHAPLILAFSDIDLAKQQAMVDYHFSALNLISKTDAQNTNTTKIPFSQLNTDLAGTATLKDSVINLRINNASKVNIKNFASSDLNTANIEISNNNEIHLRYSINDKKASLSNTDISFNATQWESQFGSISHPELTLKLSDVDFATRSAKLDFSLTDVTLQAKQLPFKQAKINAQGKIDLSYNKAALTINKGLSLKLKSLALPHIRSNNLSLKTRSPIVITAPITPEKPIADLNNIILQPVKMVLSGSAVKVAEHTLSYRSLAINLKKLSLQPLAIKADTRLTRLNLQNNKLINDINISGQHYLKRNNYYANAAIASKSLALAINAKITASQNFRKVNTSWQLKPIDLTNYTQQNIKDALPSWPDDLQITAGTYQQSGTLTKKANNITAQVDHQLNDLFLVKDKTIISNFNSKSQSNYKDNKLSQVGSLQIDIIDNGIAITDISTNFKLYNLLQDSRSLHLTDSKAQVLGATASVKKLLIPLNTPQGKATLEFRHLPLNNVLALESQPSLTGSGLLQGKLPFRFSGNKFWVNQGTINTTKNGFIRYQANESITTYAKSNSGLEIALNVLDNFHYDNLSINVNYTPDGKLLLANKLSGNNPDWQQGQPIKFAINVEENILQLLKTMQFSDQLTEKLQKKIQQSTQ
ncbi:MAG: YdbH domain-containing protein, partial [Oceanospirillaceae bacterium]